MAANTPLTPPPIIVKEIFPFLGRGRIYHGVFSILKTITPTLNNDLFIILLTPQALLT
jgi:hypothetical protein